MRSLKIALCLALSAILLTGCASYGQIEHRAYVITMGVDQNENDDCVISIQIPAIAGSGGSSGASSGTGSYVVATASAPTFAEALLLLEATTPRKLDYRQMLSFVASQEIASSPRFAELITELMFTYNPFGSTQLIICPGKAQTFLENQLPEIGTRLSDSVSAMLENYREQGYIPHAVLSDVHYKNQSVYSDPVAVYAATADQQHFRNVPENGVGTSYPGSLPHTGLAKNEYMGAVLLKNGVMAGVLNGVQTQILNMLLGDVQKIPFFVEASSMDLILKRPVSAEIDLSGNVPRIHLTFDMAARPLTSMPNPAAIEEQFAAEVRSLMELCQMLKVEPFDFAVKAAAQFATLPQWSAYNWHEQFPRADISIVITVEPM